MASAKYGVKRQYREVKGWKIRRKAAGGPQSYPRRNGAADPAPRLNPPPGLSRKKSTLTLRCYELPASTGQGSPCSLKRRTSGTVQSHLQACQIPLANMIVGRIEIVDPSIPRTVRSSYHGHSIALNHRAAFTLTCRPSFLAHYSSPRLVERHATHDTAYGNPHHCRSTAR